MKTLTYKQLCWLTFWLWLGFVVGMSAFVSHEMAAHPMAQAFADFMAQWIPMLDNIRKIPNSTEWVRFYYAVFWAVSPVFAYIGWLLRRQMCIQNIYLKPVSDLKLFVFFIGVLGFCAIALIWPVADGHSWRDQGVVSNIVGIAHFTLYCITFVAIFGAYMRLIFARFYYGTVYESAPIEEKQ